MNAATVDYLERVCLWVSDKSDGSRSFALSYGYQPEHGGHVWVVAIVDLSVAPEPWIGVSSEIASAFEDAIDRAQAQLGEASP